MKMMLLKIEVGLMKILCSLNNIDILLLSYAKEFACTSAGAQTSWRPNVLLPHRGPTTYSYPGKNAKWHADKSLAELVSYMHKIIILYCRIILGLDQRCPNPGPRAACDPPTDFMRPVSAG